MADHNTKKASQIPSGLLGREVLLFSTADTRCTSNRRRWICADTEASSQVGITIIRAMTIYFEALESRICDCGKK